MEDKIIPKWEFTLFYLDKDKDTGKIKKYFVYNKAVIIAFNTSTGFVALESGTEVWYPTGKDYFMEFVPLFDIEEYNKQNK